MATTQAGGTAVVGYFPNGDQAHRAINALIDEGFRPSEIGAAFHTGTGAMSTGATGQSLSDANTSDAGAPASTGFAGEAAWHPSKGTSAGEDLGTTSPQTTTSERTRTGTSSAASDTLAVQYASLGGGAGTPYDMPPRPGAITASDVTHSGLPSELKSTLPHDSDLQAGGAVSSGTGRGGWVDRLGPIFGTEQRSAGVDREVIVQDDDRDAGDVDQDDERTEAQDKNSGKTMEDVIRKDENNFGTGEGSLNLSTPPTQRYSQPAFQRSFSGYGVQPEHAQQLSHRIGRGGAVVTVHAASRAEAAERILQANGGEVRMDVRPLDDAIQGAAQDGEVEVFGTMGRDYPGNLQ